MSGLGGTMGSPWVGEAFASVKKGTLTRMAKTHGYSSALPFAKEVIKHPESYTEKARKKSQFLVNVNK